MEVGHVDNNEEGEKRSNIGIISKMLLTEYDEKLHMKTLYEQGKEDGREEGYETGYFIANERINQLYSILLEEQRTEELAKAINNSEYRKRLLEEYKL